MATSCALQARAQKADNSRKDPAALSLLDALFAQNGWKSEDEVTKFLATGKSTNPSSPNEHENHQISISVSGSSRYRYDDLTADLHIVKNGPLAAFVHSQQTTVLDPQQTATIEPWPFPFLTALRLYRRPGVALRSLPGSDSIANGNTEIEIDIPFSGSNCCSTSVGPQQTRYIATIQEGQLECLRQLSPQIPNHQALKETSWQWGDYRKVGETTIPFQSEYHRGADDIMSLTLEEITPLDGLSSEIFAIHR